MVLILKKVGGSEDEFGKLNQNFDQISREISDRSGSFSSVGSVEGLTIAAGEAHLINVQFVDTQYVVDLRELYTRNKTSIQPRVAIYMDGSSNTDANYYPNGSDFTSSQTLTNTIRVETGIQRTVPTNAAASIKATYWIKIYNGDSSSHDFWIYTDVYFLPSPDVGVTKRATDA